METVNFFSVDYNPIDTSDILDIRRYLMKKCLELLKNVYCINN